MNWVEVSKELGEIKEDRKHAIKFQGLEDMKDISNLSSSCGCTTPKFNKSTKELTVVYSAKKVSEHLRHSVKRMNVSQNITVTYSDGKKEVLSFNAIVIV